MMKLIVLLLATVAAYGQWSPVGSGYATLNSNLDSKANFQLLSGAPTALNCTAGKDTAFDTTGLNYWDCSVTGTPGTWIKRTYGLTQITQTSLLGAWLATLSSSSGSAYIGTVSNCPVSLVAWQTYYFVPNVTNSTTTPTLAVCGFAAMTMTNGDGSALLTTSVLDTSGTSICAAKYNGSVFELSGCIIGPGYTNYGVIAASAVPTPGTNVIASFFDSSNSNHFSVKNSSGGVTDLQGGATIVSGTATIPTTTINSGTCGSAVTVTAAGITTSSFVGATVNGDPTAVTGYTPATTGTLYIWAYPTSGNVNFKLCNNTAANITPGSTLTLNWRAF